MMLILLLVALAVSGVGALIRGRSPKLSQVLIVVGVVSLAAITVIQIRQVVSPPVDRSNNRGEMSVGSSLANCVIGDLARQNGTVILIFPARPFMDADTEESYETGFMLPMRHGHGLLHFKAVQLEGKPGKTGYDLAAFQQVLEKNPDVLGVVSYAGMPVGFDNLFSSGQPKTPRFYFFDAEGTTNWVASLKSGQVGAVVVPRPGADARARDAASGKTEDIFEQYYLLATQGTADQVVAQIGKK